jgi:hypothetical protein
MTTPTQSPTSPTTTAAQTAMEARLSLEPWEEDVAEPLGRMWPVDILLGVLAATCMYVAAMRLPFDHPQWERNAWTYLLGIPAGFFAIDLLLRNVASRFIHRSMQFAFVISVTLHVCLMAMAVNLVLLSRSWPDAKLGAAAQPNRTPRTIPDRIVAPVRDSVGSPEELTRPVEVRLPEAQRPELQRSPETLEQPPIKLEEPTLAVPRASADPIEMDRAVPTAAQPEFENREQRERTAEAPSARPPTPVIRDLPVTSLQPEASQDLELSSDTARARTEAVPQSAVGSREFELPAADQSLGALTELTQPQRIDAAPQLSTPDVTARARQALAATPRRVSGPVVAPRAPVVPQAPPSAISEALLAQSVVQRRAESAAQARFPLALDSIEQPRLNESSALSTSRALPSGGPVPDASGPTIAEGPPNGGVPRRSATPLAAAPRSSGPVAIPGLGPGSGRGQGATISDATGSRSGSAGARDHAEPLASALGSLDRMDAPQRGTSDRAAARIAPSRGASTSTEFAGPELAIRMTDSLTAGNGTALRAPADRSNKLEPDPSAGAPGGIDRLGRPLLSGAAPPGLQQSKASQAFEARLQRTQGGGAAPPAGLVGPETELAIERGLAFLAQQQREDGRWQLQSLDEDLLIRADTAATGLCVLAFQGAGYTHQRHRYAERVRKGLQFLLDNQKPDGDLFLPEDPDSNRNVWLYSHGIATLALCEAYGMTRDPDLAEPAQRAIDFIVASQHPTRGGWRYQPANNSDTSVSGWMMLALKSGELAGLRVPDKTYEGIRTWLQLSQVSAEQSYLYRYNPFAPDTDTQRHGRMPTRTMTAVGLLSRLYVGNWEADDPALLKGADYLCLPDNLPNSQTPLDRDTYYWYYATQVIFHVGGEPWKAWNEALRRQVIGTQMVNGPLSGSWHPMEPVADRWGPHAGRLYVTAMNLLSLEVYYRHLPLYR